MEKKTTLRILLTSLLFSSFLFQIHARNKQSQVLDRLFRSKRSGNSAIDTRLFEESPNVNKANVVLSQHGLKEKDKIDKFPGQPSASFDQYGGYVTVNESAGRAFYYYFVEAEKSKESLPLVLWLNGGIIYLDYKS